jgi:hypothetical protein
MSDDQHKMPVLALDNPRVDNSNRQMENPYSNRLTVRDLGQIAAFHIPANWIETTEEPTDPQWTRHAYSRDFSPPDDPSATLSIYFRSLEVSEASAGRFTTLLRQLPHELSAQEIGSINQVLSKMADEDAFDMRGAQTHELGNRRVLIIDGEWKASQAQFHGLMIQADDSGREIQEIFFEAPLNSFMKYLNEVVDSIRTIEWI